MSADGIVDALSNAARNADWPAFEKAEEAAREALQLVPDSAGRHWLRLRGPLIAALAAEGAEIVSHAGEDGRLVVALLRRPSGLLKNLQTWLTHKLIGTAAAPAAETIKAWIAALSPITGDEVPSFAAPENPTEALAAAPTPVSVQPARLLEFPSIPQASSPPTLDESLGRLRDSIAWLRDGRRIARGIGVADMVVLEAALAAPAPQAAAAGRITIDDEQTAYGIGYCNPGRMCRMIEWKHLVFANAFRCGQLDAQNAAPRNRAYSARDYDAETFERLGAILMANGPAETREVCDDCGAIHGPNGENTRCDRASASVATAETTVTAGTANSTICGTSAAASVAGLAGAVGVDALVEALQSIERYGLDTLSGRVDGPDDRDWQRAAVHTMMRRARSALAQAASTRAGSETKP